MIKNENIEPGENPPYLDNYLISLTPGVIFDGHPIGRNFGAVITQPDRIYSVNEVVYTRFQAANPRNNLMHDKTYFTVEHYTPDGMWNIIATDANWETNFRWNRVSSIFGTSEIQFHWEIPANTEAGLYRICYFGHNRELFGGVSAFTGCTQQFDVETSRKRRY